MTIACTCTAEPSQCVGERFDRVDQYLCSGGTCCSESPNAVVIPPAEVKRLGAKSIAALRRVFNYGKKAS